MGDAAGAVTTTIEDGVAVVRLDDGKANVLSHATIDGLAAAVDRAEAEARALCLVGREGLFCAGFDLSVMKAGPDAARELVARGGELMMRLFLHPQPVVAAVTGHALAAGALLVLSCDVRIGADVPAKVGLPETSIGMPVPLFATELARDRLDRRVVTRATLGSEIFDMPGAVGAGYVDRVAPADRCAAEAVAEARRLGEFSRGAYAYSKELLRGPLVERARAGSAADLARFSVAPPG